MERGVMNLRAVFLHPRAIGAVPVVASVVMAAVMFSAVQQAAALGLRMGGIGGMGGFRGGFAGFHRGGERFPMGDHFGRFNGRHFSRFFRSGPFLGGLVYGPYAGYPYAGYPYAGYPYAGYPYAGSSSYPSYGTNAGVASPEESLAYSGGQTGSYYAAPDCIVYKLNYDDKGAYQGVTAVHLCRDQTAN